MRLRVLHFLILGCVMLLGTKIADVIVRKQSLSEILSVSDIYAQEEEDEEEKADAEDGDEEEEDQVDIRKELIFTETEVEILKRLKQRRSKLEQWEEKLKVKDSVLRVTQTKINQKLQELRSLKKDVEKLLEQYNQKEDAKIRSLVKIYENMKPKDAARIFKNLDMAVLLQVINKMKEAKSALILAKMDANRAKELTILFAAQRKLISKEQ